MGGRLSGHGADSKSGVRERMQYYVVIYLYGVWFERVDLEKISVDTMEENQACLRTVILATVIFATYACTIGRVTVAPCRAGGR